MACAKSDYLVVGAGVNGTSIATTLVSLGYSVAVLDRSPDGFVAADGASNDLNKIIRADYTDGNYCTLAKEAISLWRTHPILHKFYHEVGVLFRSSDRGTVWGGAGSGSGEEYVRRGVEKARLEREGYLEVGATRGRAYVLEDDKQVRAVFEGKAVRLGEGMTGMGERQTGYMNPRGGWAEANAACRALLAHAVRLGVTLHANSTVTAFITENNRITGVRTADGRAFYADHIVLAAGAWTSDLLTTLVPPAAGKVGQAGWMTRPSAQCVAILRLTAAQAASIRGTPVIINFATGFYQFEPTWCAARGEWLLKIAYHSNGYVYPKPRVECSGGYPSFEASAFEARTATRQLGSEGDDAGYDMAAPSIPATQLDAMLAELGAVYPDLAARSNVLETRVCWYSDTLDENWIIDTLNHHPQFTAKAMGENVWVVSGDSGHAYKFLPLIGSLFASIAKLQPNTRLLDLHRFTFAHQVRLHQLKAQGEQIESADSNRFSEDKAKEANARARL
ncbi:related to fructosyl amino acid oxidase [Sporisorium reilianum SRZ2]|uniref:Related to fructosyl amino acid oxidase n=1 Tax=Sporisorium reilianum (strain SRZ2) TaxID=999809 RepID=E6ZMU3_SPORE|nr:related to fructosyl amino acid oxidase [Sporisorium reilianum SRZ2]